jgi:putative holliday junction resolvase
MSKIIALDIGDQWTGVAITDASGIFARPLTTIPAQDVDQFLAKILAQERIKDVVIGYPKTMKGGESIQTKKIVTYKEHLEQLFPGIIFILWDERLSSKRASTLVGRKTKEDKLKSHALAAAFILDSYVSFLRLRTE